MATRRTKKSWASHDVVWFFPRRKTPVAYSTVACSDTIDMIAEGFPNLTLAEVRSKIHFDTEAHEVLDVYIEMGAGGMTKAELDEAVRTEAKIPLPKS